jgi:hypothetical protein
MDKDYSRSRQLPGCERSIHYRKHHPVVPFLPNGLQYRRCCLIGGGKVIQEALDAFDFFVRRFLFQYLSLSDNVVSHDQGAWV